MLTSPSAILPFFEYEQTTIVNLLQSNYSKYALQFKKFIYSKRIVLD
ncbi:hypothetical protein NIES4075_33640 [Tolypothrix sp. NIES-4075]|nr:hypothetical protein NIES4075_33640 [Tolypothrix sp. NIES-4075]